MQEPILNPSWDTVLVAAPFVIMLALGIFRLDVILARPKGEAVSADRVWGTDRWGEPLLCDPDGRDWGTEGASAVNREGSSTARSDG